MEVRAAVLRVKAVVTIRGNPNLSYQRRLGLGLGLGLVLWLGLVLALVLGLVYGVGSVLTRYHREYWHNTHT